MNQEHIKDLLGNIRYEKYLAWRTRASHTLPEDRLLSCIAEMEGWQDVKAYVSAKQAVTRDCKELTRFYSPGHTCLHVPIINPIDIPFEKLAEIDCRHKGRTYIPLHLGGPVDWIKVTNPPCDWSVVLDGEIAGDPTYDEVWYAKRVGPSLRDKYRGPGDECFDGDSRAHTINFSTVKEAAIVFDSRLHPSLLKDTRITYHYHNLLFVNDDHQESHWCYTHTNAAH